ncbi:hypothetical protein [Saccharomonospora sp. NB11]|uniref:hypothetical protein n=1 Tax=Saccharomonospora sp. NB11 TaxID=1642298 RepID=UPI0018D0779A|nr:hypothetical protein [Saccharomonospora sp. NB11]
MSSGHVIRDYSEFDEFSRTLDTLASDLRSTGDLVGSMVADPGLWGVLLGQVIGAAASKFCADARDALNDYGEAIELHKEKLDKARRLYEETDRQADESISRYQL